MKHNYNTKELMQAIKDVRASEDTPKAFIRFVNEYPQDRGYIQPGDRKIRSEAAYPGDDQRCTHREKRIKRGN